MAGTLMPWWSDQFCDADGDPLASGTVETYEAGTNTPLATYSNAALSSSNGTTLTLNAGGFPEVAGIEVGVFLLPRAYKFVLKNSAGVTVRTRDNVYALQAASSSNLEIDGVAGENLSAGDWAYLSDGSNALTAGRWYKTDSDLYYASIHPELAFVPSAITAGATGTFRIGGIADSLSGLAAGTTYFLSGTAGAITATAPANARSVGVAISATSIRIDFSPPWLAQDDPLGIADGRLSAATGVPVTATDVSSTTSIYYVPYVGNRVALFDGSKWKTYSFSELTLALGTITSGLPYDVFLYDNSGTLTLELTAWTNTTTRATALTTQNGVYVKSGATTKRYIGTIKTISTTQTADTARLRLVWNMYNRVPRPWRVIESTDSWAYSTATVRQANGSATNQVEGVFGLLEDAIQVRVTAASSNNNADIARRVYVGEDSTTAAVSGSLMAGNPTSAYPANQTLRQFATYAGFPSAIGYHYYAWLEYSGATATTTWYGDAGDPTQIQSGIEGVMYA